MAPWPTGAEGGVFGPVCGSVGALAAGEAIKVLAGVGEPLVGRIAMVDAFSGEMSCLPVGVDPCCRACAGAGRVLKTV